MIKIFERYINIKNREGLLDCTEEKLEVLSKMLTEYGIAHCFSLTNAKEIEEIEAKGMEYCVSLLYEEKDEVALELIYMLWAKLERNVSDDLIKKAWGKNGIVELKENGDLGV